MNTDGGAIDFSAKSNNEAQTGVTVTNNKLVHYEDGSWTPKIFINNIEQTGYTEQFGTYTKVGRLVTIKMRLVGDGTAIVGGPTDQVTIRQLPYRAHDQLGSVSFEGGGSVYVWHNFNTSMSDCRFTIRDLTGPGGTQSDILLWRITSNTTSSFSQSLQGQDLTTTYDIRLIATYFTDE